MSKATPFVKWVGGKRSVINELVARVPKDFGNYYEPFVGGGALFFELADSLKGKEVHLSDANAALVTTYNVIKYAHKELLILLQVHSYNHSDEYYYTIRNQHGLVDSIEIAARFIYLNKTCFNGLYRVNKSGKFNVPVGNYKNPAIVSPENIVACHGALENVTIFLNNYDIIAPQKGDLVYFDPPYQPINEISFKSYTKDGFTEADQIKLRDFALELHSKGVNVMLSNSDVPFIGDIYSSPVFRVNKIQVSRSVNSDATKRGKVGEVLITTY